MKIKNDSIDSDERVGRIPTHFFKTRTLLRSEPNKDYLNISHKIPSHWQGVEVLYDIYFDRGIKDHNNIPILEGFGYTDFFNKWIYFRPFSRVLDELYLKNLLTMDIKIDKRLVNSMINSIGDKYVQKPLSCKNNYPSGVIFLPGTNLLETKYIDYSTVKQAVKNGAKVKPHPLTTRFHHRWLEHIFGKKNLIDINESGLSYLMNCDEIFGCGNSEMLLKAILMDKKVHIVELDNSECFGGFRAIYRASKLKKENILKIISSDRSGIINVQDKSFEKKMNNFFNSFNLLLTKKSV